MTDSGNKTIRLGLSELTNDSLYDSLFHIPTTTTGLTMEMTKEEQDQKMIIDCYRMIFNNADEAKRIAALPDAHQINELVACRYMLSKKWEQNPQLPDTDEYSAFCMVMANICTKTMSLNGELDDGIYSLSTLLEKFGQRLVDLGMKDLFVTWAPDQLFHVKLGFFSSWAYSHYSGVNTVKTVEETPYSLSKFFMGWLSLCRSYHIDSKLPGTLDEYRRKTGLSTCEEMKDRLRSIGIPEKDLKGIPDVGYMWPKSIEDDGEVTITPSLEMSINWANKVKEMESTMIKNEEYKPKNQMLVPVYCFDNSDGNIVLVTGSSVVVTKRIVGSLANVDYDELLEAAKNTAIESMLPFDVACTDDIGYLIQRFVPYVDARSSTLIEEYDRLKSKSDFVTNDSVRDNPLNSVINIQMDIPEPLENYLIGTRFPHMFTGLPFVGRDMK